jgi:hypothetical protein
MDTNGSDPKKKASVNGEKHTPETSAAILARLPELPHVSGQRDGLRGLTGHHGPRLTSGHWASTFLRPFANLFGIGGDEE